MCLKDANLRSFQGGQLINLNIIELFHKDHMTLKEFGLD